MDAAELHRALMQPAAYARVVAGAGEVALVETHLSRLYFVGARVYKVKKGVDLGFVDFSTLAKRKAACDDEVRLNRRLAPKTYLGVVPIGREAGGAIGVGAPEPAIEYAVEMERLPAEGMLDRRLERGEIDGALVERLVETLAGFHARAERGAAVDAFATAEAIGRRVTRNLDEAEAAGRRLDELTGAATPTVPPLVIDALRLAFVHFVDAQGGLFARRIAERRICEGHGDLHAGNVCLLPGAPGAAPRVVAFDCIEFSRELRCVDVAADLAFLLMDLDRLGFPAFGADVARRYAERTRDPDLATLLPFHEAHLAAVRAKVAALRGAGSSDPAVREAGRAESRRYLALAARRLLPPALVATCGLPGSGKSTIARTVAAALHLSHVRSDFERKLLCGLAPAAPTPPGRLAQVYSPETTERTYARLHELARDALARGRGALLDATFARAADRAAAAGLARSLSTPSRPVPFVVVHCRIDDDEARRRLAGRVTGPDQFSDADFAIYERARPAFEPPAEIPPRARVDVDPATPVEETTLAVVELALTQIDAARRPAAFRGDVA
jgi:uncharacterized protein